MLKNWENYEDEVLPAAVAGPGQGQAGVRAGRAVGRRGQRATSRTNQSAKGFRRKASL